MISRWTVALLSVESRIVWRISCSPASEGAQEAMTVWKERRGIEEKRYAFELTMRFSIHCTQTTIWPCLRSGTGDPGNRENSIKTQRNWGTAYCDLSYLHGPRTGDSERQLDLSSLSCELISAQTTDINEKMAR